MDSICEGAGARRVSAALPQVDRAILVGCARPNGGSGQLDHTPNRLLDAVPFAGVVSGDARATVAREARESDSVPAPAGAVRLLLCDAPPRNVCVSIFGI